jgi:RNA-binding protein
MWRSTFGLLLILLIAQAGPAEERFITQEVASRFLTGPRTVHIYLPPSYHREPNRPYPGKEGLSPQFLAALDEVLKRHELVKVRLDEFKEQKKELAPQLAEKSGSHLVTRMGNVVVVYRPKPTEEKQPES